jgi:hypothetical protein
MNELAIMNVVGNRLESLRSIPAKGQNLSIRSQEKTPAHIAPKWQQAILTSRRHGFGRVTWWLAEILIQRACDLFWRYIDTHSRTHWST